jgi:hypothetical protein
VVPTIETGAACSKLAQNYVRLVGACQAVGNCSRKSGVSGSQE